MVRCTKSVSQLEHRRNEKISEEARVEPIAMVTERRRLERPGRLLPPINISFSVYADVSPNFSFTVFKRVWFISCLSRVDSL